MVREAKINMQVPLTPAEDGKLTAMAEKEGISKADILRRALKRIGLVEELDSNGIVLANKDTQGNLKEIGPISLIS